MRRVVVIGATGAGKTTLAQILGRRLGVPATDLDDLHWSRNWVPRSFEEFSSSVAAASAGEGWIIAGNYTRVRDMIWSRADTVIWLDYGFAFVLGRLIKRSLTRLVDQQEICNGNRESLRLLFSRKSVVLWLLQTFRKKRRDYGAVFAAPGAWPHLRFIRLRGPRATDAFVASLPSQ